MSVRPEERLRQAQANVVLSKRRLDSSIGALQYRLKPGTLMNNAWEGVRDKGETLADGALQAVKERPGTVSGVIAGFVLFLAREPLWRLVTALVPGRREDDTNIIKADLDGHDPSFDLTAPTVERSQIEGVNA